MLRLQKLLGKVQGNLSQALAAPGRPFLVRKVLRDTKWPISRAPRCGAGSAAMPFALGNTEAGSSLAIPTLRTKLVRSSIYTSVLGKALRWALMITLFPPTK